MDTSKKYQPISCVFYDLIEHYATRKELVHILISKDGKTERYHSRILDTKIIRKVEFMVLDHPRIDIRLDQIISLNDDRLASFNKC